MVGKLAFSIASLVGEKAEASKIAPPDDDDGHVAHSATAKPKNADATAATAADQAAAGESALASAATAAMIEQQNETWKKLQQAFSLGAKDSAAMPFSGFPAFFAGQQAPSNGVNILDPFRTAATTTTPSNQWLEFVQKNLAATSLYARLSQQQQVPQTGGPQPFLPASLLPPGVALAAHSASRHHPGLGHQSAMGNVAGGQGHGAFFSFRKPKRIRTAFSPSQLLHLEHSFDRNHYVVGAERKDLAKSLGLSETQVKVWFQNRRTKYKRHKTDEESRKRCSGGGGGGLPSSSMSSMTHILSQQRPGHAADSSSSTRLHDAQQRSSNLHNNNANDRHPSSIDYQSYEMAAAGGGALSEVESDDSASSIDGENNFSANSSAASMVFDVSKHTNVQ